MEEFLLLLQLEIGVERLILLRLRFMTPKRRKPRSLRTKLKEAESRRLHRRKWSRSFDRAPDDEVICSLVRMELHTFDEGFCLRQRLLSRLVKFLECELEERSPTAEGPKGCPAERNRSWVPNRGSCNRSPDLDWSANLS